MFQECLTSHSIFNSDIMRDKRNTWALSNDVDLLNELENFSKRLLDRTHSLLEKIENFEATLKITHIEIKTISNNFEAVADNQFVENRVYDEEEDVVFSFQRKNKELIPDVCTGETLETALKRCASIIEDKFEAVNIPLSDSEDDTDVGSNNETVFVLKNRYKLRPLPHLIGGQEFYNDDSLGLFDLSERKEGMNESIMNGQDDQLTKSESSSFDEPDETSSIPENKLAKSFEVSNASGSKDNDNELVNSQESPIKNSDFLTFKESIYKSHLESSTRKKSDSCEITEESKVFSESANVQTKAEIISGANIKSSIHDELKRLFSNENAHDVKPKYKVYEKTQEVNKQLSTAAISNENSNYTTGHMSRIINQNLITSQNPLSSNDPDSFVKDVDRIFNSEEDSNSEVINNQNKIECHEETSVSSSQNNDASNDPLSMEDSMLPSVQTEILYSFAKERAKIKGKRRLPSRKPKSMESENNQNDVFNNAKENPVLSPSTDEEDLFYLPESQVTKESHASSLFSKPSLFSPGSSIEHESRSFTASEIKEKDNNDMDDKSHLFDEPLGIFKTQPPVKQEKTKQLFKEWDPFDSDDGDLFPNIEKRSRTKKLFDDVPDNSLKSSFNNADDLFNEKIFTTNRNSFENDHSNPNTSTKENKKSILFSSGLFGHESDDDFDTDTNLFAKDTSYKSPFSLLNNDLSKGTKNSSKNSSSLLSGPKLSIQKEVYSNPLLDPDEDSIFD